MRNFTIILILLLIIISGNIFAYNEYQGLEIKEIKFEGLKFYTEDILKNNLQTTVGGKFSTYYINKDFKRLYTIGAFKDIKLFVQKTSGNKLIITFKVEEFPKIAKIIFEGIEELSESDVKEVLRLKEDSHYNPAYIKRDRDAVLKLYKEKGFMNTSVAFSLENSEKPNMVILKIKINEGEKILIEQIVIQGTKQLDPNDIKKFMESSETTLIGGEQTYTALKKKNDIMRILAFARWKGFIFARVVRYDVRIDWVDPEFKERRGYYIEIEIEEGPRYKMGDITFQGNELFVDRELKSLMKIKKGEYYNELDFKQSVKTISDAYQTQGYIYVKITIIEKYDRENKVVNFIFNIFDGDRAHIETIVFRGNTKTKSYVLDRELRIWEGEVYNNFRVELSKNRLIKLGFFKTVNKNLRPSSEEGLVDLVYTVEPQRTGMLSFGGGYGTLTGFTAFAEVSENNLLGRGYRISARVEYGEKKREIRVSWSSRYLTTYTPISYSFSVGYRWQKRLVVPYYDRNNDGIPDKIIYNTSGNLILLQSSDRGATNGSTTINDPYGSGPISYDIIAVSEDTWLEAAELDTSGDGVISEADGSSDERFYKERTIFAGATFGYAFANYFYVFSGYTFSASKLYDPSYTEDNVTTYYTDYDTLVAGSGGQSYNDNMRMIYVDNLFEELPGQKTTFKNALLTENWLLTSKIPVGFVFDNTNDNFNPLRGLSFKATWSFVGIGGDVKYNEFNVDLNYYISLPFKVVWANRISLGVIMPWFGNKNPLALEGNKLSFDGINETRGWQDFVYLDRYMGYGRVVLSTELRWPIPATKGILWWVFFFDAGGIKKDIRGGRLPVDIESEYIYSWGFGLRIQIPMFPIRLYGAQRMRWEHGRLVVKTDGLEFVFSIAGYF